MRQKVDFDLTRARQLLESGMSLRATAEVLGISDRTLRRRLQDDKVHVKSESELNDETLLLKPLEEIEISPDQLLQLRQCLLAVDIPSPSPSLSSAIDSYLIFVGRIESLARKLATEHSVRNRLLDQLRSPARKVLGDLLQEIASEQLDVEMQITTAIKKAIFALLDELGEIFSIYLCIEQLARRTNASQPITREFLSRGEAGAFLALHFPSAAQAMNEAPYLAAFMTLLGDQGTALRDKYLALVKMQDCLKRMTVDRLLMPLRVTGGVALRRGNKCTMDLS